MQTDKLAQKREVLDRKCRDALLSRFRNALDDLEKSWTATSLRSPFYPFLTWTDEGAKLGAGTLIARRDVRDDARLLALTSIAFGSVVPADILKHLAWAEAEFNCGNLVKSAMHIALTGLPALAAGEAARRLHKAAGILDNGFLTPAGLLKACEMDCREIESIAKAYNPDQPCVLAGSPDGGQWTRDDAGGGRDGSQSRSRRIPSSELGFVLPEGCEEEWQWAREYCAKLLAMPNPPIGLTGGHKTVDGCAKGFVSERCGGNRV